MQIYMDHVEVLDRGMAHFYPNNVEADLRGNASPENIINKVIKI
jgi:hypothetical protein